MKGAKHQFDQDKKVHAELREYTRKANELVAQAKHKLAEANRKGYIDGINAEAKETEKWYKEMKWAWFCGAQVVERAEQSMRNIVVLRQKLVEVGVPREEHYKLRGDNTGQSGSSGSGSGDDDDESGDGDDGDSGESDQDDDAGHDDDAGDEEEAGQDD